MHLSMSCKQIVELKRYQRLSAVITALQPSKAMRVHPELHSSDSNMGYLSFDLLFPLLQV